MANITKNEMIEFITSNLSDDELIEILEKHEVDGFELMKHSDLKDIYKSLQDRVNVINELVKDDELEDNEKIEHEKVNEILDRHKPIENKPEKKAVSKSKDFYNLTLKWNDLRLGTNRIRVIKMNGPEYKCIWKSLGDASQSELIIEYSNGKSTYTISVYNINSDAVRRDFEVHNINVEKE